MRRVVELKGAQLQREPIGRVGRQGHVAQRPADVPRRLAAETRRFHHVRDERGRRGLPVGAGDADAPGASQGQEPDVHFGIALEPGRAGGLERRNAWRHARSHHHCGRPADPVEIVVAQLDGRTELPELRRPDIVCGPGGGVGRVDGKPLVPKQPRGRDPALPEPDHRHLATARAPAFEQLDRHGQRTLRVERATRAQKRPRM